MVAGNGCVHPEYVIDFARGVMVCTNPKCGHTEEVTVTSGTLGPDGEVIPDNSDDG
jgi:hypothetical protein